MTEWTPIDELLPEEAVELAEEVEKTVNTKGFEILTRCIRNQQILCIRKGGTSNPNQNSAMSCKAAGMQFWFDQIQEIFEERDRAVAILNQRERPAEEEDR